MSDVRTGISGWRYPPWRGVFYPPGLPQRWELKYAASRLRTIEINGSFYSLQRPESYRSWAAQTPDDFVFAVKASQYMTHMKRLGDLGPSLQRFYDGIRPLADSPKLGPVLGQLPGRMKADGPLLADGRRAGLSFLGQFRAR